MLLQRRVLLLPLLALAISGCYTSNNDSSSSSSSEVSSTISSVTSSSSQPASSSSSSSGEPTTTGICPVDEPCRILPLGDSITEGMVQSGGGQYQFNGGYRVALFEAAVNDGKSITFVGSRSNGPNTVAGQTFPKSNGGISGETIQQIDNRIPVPELDDHPHIILLHAGTNDMFQSANGAINRLEALIEDIVNNEPDALLVVSNLIPLGFGDVSNFNAGIPALVERKAQELQADIIFVDQFEGFPNSELPDSVHPNAAGYERMGLKWYEAIKEHLN